MEKLVLDGKEFVKASRAAKDLGYTSDYVGQLCRSGKVGAHLVGRSWYVNATELEDHRSRKKRISRVKGREQAHKAREENRLRNSTSASQKMRKIEISYEEDDTELLPETRKLDILSEPIKKSKKKVTDEGGPNYTIENEGHKVRMQGSIDIEDVTDGPVDTETTILSPQIIRGENLKKQKDTSRNTAKNKAISVDTTEIEESISGALKSKTDFKDRLVEHGALDGNLTVAPITQADPLEEEDVVSIEDKSEAGTLHLVGIIVSVLLIGGISLISLSLNTEFNYTRTEVRELSKTYSISIQETIDLIKLKI